MNYREIGFHRLSNQRIGGEKFEKPEDVVKWLGALQAQDYMQAVWAIGLRTKSGTLADIEQAIENGKIIRTWPMRGTIHFIPPEDARWMLKLSAARLLAADQRRMDQLELSVEIMARCQDLFYGALSGGRRLSRPEMMKLLEDAGISTEKQRGYHILWYISQSGIICPGPMQDKQQTFVLLDEWVPELRELSREDGLAELARRYFAGHGPATVHDFAWWVGITITEARLGLEAAKPGLVSEKIEGKEYWMGASSPARESVSGVYLLPGFDEYLLGYKDRDAVLAAEYAQKIVPGNNGVFLPMIVVEGQVVGTWKRSLKKKAVDITLQPFMPLGPLEDRIIETAQSYADFIGQPLISKIVNADV
ncbi:MAG: AlkZ family DNA glycosylase [Chloroflexi bacterium]|nr:AlkZ family DNA glycosylase [Chloroflexota bacterium]